jgi:hypothetical protein
MNQSRRHRQEEAPGTVGAIFAGINPPTDSDRYVAWISRLGRMPLPVSQPTFPWQRIKGNVVPFKKETQDAA